MAVQPMLGVGGLAESWEDVGDAQPCAFQGRRQRARGAMQGAQLFGGHWHRDERQSGKAPWRRGY